MVSDTGGSEDVIRYNIRSRPSDKAQLRWLLPILITAFVVYVIVRRPPADEYVTIAIGILLAVALSRATGSVVVVNREGFKRSMRKLVPWSDVNYVEYLGSRERSVTLQLKNGKTLQTGLPTEYREQVASIGSVPIGKGFRGPQ